jgi:FMN-dependent NADH-azoreductase
MSTILYLKASPRGSRSHSLAVAEAFLEGYRQAHPEDQVVTLDLFTLDLPAFDGLRINAKYNIMHGQTHNAAEVEAWKVVEQYIGDFKSADKYVLASPMWNFGIPYRLKHYFDIIVQPGYTFSYAPETGYQGLVTGKPIFLALARGGQYPQGDPAAAVDLQRPYLELILKFMGFNDIRSVIVEPTLAEGPAVAQARRQAGMEKAREMGKSF